MLIRPAEPKDYLNYCDLTSEVDLMHFEHAPRYYLRVGVPSRTREHYDSILQDQYQKVFFSEVEGEIAGFIHLEVGNDPDYPVLVPMKFAHITIIVVGKKFQRRGVGRALIHQAVLWAKENGCKDLRLSVADFNDKAREFYRRVGFGLKSQKLAMPLE
jgi:ribosomal protein S18 acetylase RimI-like enzyme